MSKFLKEPIYNKRGLENAWIGIIYSTHDTICGCNDPINHLNYLIDQQKCHHSTKEVTTTKETTGTAGKEETGFDDGDLERLFQEDDEKDG